MTVYLLLLTASSSETPPPPSSGNPVTPVTTIQLTKGLDRLKRIWTRKGAGADKSLRMVGDRGGGGGGPWRPMEEGG